MNDDTNDRRSDDALEVIRLMQALVDVVRDALRADVYWHNELESWVVGSASSGCMHLREVLAHVVAKRDELTDWMMIADGVKHDWRCRTVTGDTSDSAWLCLRCQVERLQQQLPSPPADGRIVDWCTSEGV